MPLTRWNPWEELETLQSAVDRMWNQFFHKLNEEFGREREQIGFIPDVDVVDTGYEYRIYVSVPGLVEEDIDLLLDNESLVIRGERLPPYDSDRHQSQRTEWRYGYFERRLRFAQPVRQETLRAQYEAGVLTIVVDKAA